MTDNSGRNPYAVVAPVTAGTVKQGAVLVGNFNNSPHQQGTGSTIIHYRPDADRCQCQRRCRAI